MKKKFLIYASMLLNTVNVDQAHALQWSSRRTFYFPEHPHYPTLFSAPTAAYYLCILNLLKARCKLNYSPSYSPSLSLLVLSHLSLPDTCCFIISVISDIFYLF